MEVASSQLVLQSNQIIEFCAIADINQTVDNVVVVISCILFIRAIPSVPYKLLVLLCKIQE